MFPKLRRRLDRSMNRDSCFRLLQAGRESALHHESGEEAGRAGNAVLAMDQYPFAFVRLLPQPKHSFFHMLGIDGSYVGGWDAFVRFAAVLCGLISSPGVLRIR